MSEVYEAFARHWGFVALPSRPRHPQEQGIQENAGGYVKRNALKGRRFESLEELNRHLVQWNRTRSSPSGEHVRVACLRSAPTPERLAAQFVEPRSSTSSRAPSWSRPGRC